MKRTRKAASRGKLRLGLLAGLVMALPALAGCPKSDEPTYYIRRLQKDNAEVQRRAVEELVRMHKKAMPYITGKYPGDKEKTREAAIDSENPNVRKGCADFLAKVRRMESVEAAGELIGDEDKDVRLKAIEAVAALSQVWKKRSVELLKEAFEQDDPECVKEAGEGLRDMEYDGATDALREELEAGQGIQTVYAARLLYEIEPKAETARPLLEGLISEDQKVRQAAKENVTELLDKIVEPLVTFIDTEKGTGRAMLVLNMGEGNLRDKLIEELDVILDSTRAADILIALGTIADDPCLDKLQKDLLDTKLETAWRVAAADGMAVAALSDRSTPDQKARISNDLTEVLSDEDQDKRIRIGAAIAVCKMRQEHAVHYLLDELDLFQEAIQKESISEARLDDLTRLRIGAQEALTTAGDFVVPFLLERLRQPDAGPIIIWAAAKTLGELKREDGVTFLGRYLKSKTDPEISVAPDGTLSGEGATADWQDLSDEEAEETEARLEVFQYPDYVRWTSAIALGQIGGDRALSLLRDGEEAEGEFLARLTENRERKDYRRRAEVIDGLIRRHEEVLFYIRKSLQELAAAQ